MSQRWITFDDITEVTLEWMRNHPYSLDDYMRCVMSDQWRLRSPFIYKVVNTSPEQT